MFNDMTHMITKHLTLDQSTEIKTDTLQLSYQKSNASNIQSSFSIQDGDVKLPSLCSLLEKTGSDCKTSVIFQKVKFYLKTI